MNVMLYTTVTQHPGGQDVGSPGPGVVVSYHGGAGE